MMGEAFAAYFDSLFTASGGRGLGDCLEAVEGRVTEATHESLGRPFSEIEIKEALSQLAPLKAPGPNGYNAGFFPKKLGRRGTRGLQCYTLYS